MTARRPRARNGWCTPPPGLPDANHQSAYAEGTRQPAGGQQAAAKRAAEHSSLCKGQCRQAAHAPVEYARRNALRAGKAVLAWWSSRASLETRRRLTWVKATTRSARKSRSPRRTRTRSRQPQSDLSLRIVCGASSPHAQVGSACVFSVSFRARPFRAESRNLPLLPFAQRDSSTLFRTLGMTTFRTR
jgi:hypothetical protein